MSKKISPRQGVNVDDHLIQMINEPQNFEIFQSPEQVEVYLTIVNFIRGRINGDSCMHGAQKSFTNQDIFRYVDAVLQTDVDLNSLMSDLELRRIVDSLNGYHLDCIHCLNKTCEKRDPDVPFEKVEARIKKDE